MIWKYFTFIFGASNYETMLRFAEVAGMHGVDIAKGIYHDEETDSWFAVYRCTKRKNRKLKSDFYGCKVKDNHYIWGA